MRIGCLQFNPQVGDVDNNLSRADSVLLKANPDDLDLLVLPELAFTGYNFKSLREISPFLEPAGSGISALWARTTALKYNCHVAVGYPEKVDCARKWPTSPEYYNSVIVVNPDGETVANYRKSHLYYTDETWALESPAGFFQGAISCLGQTSIGICMDINPYKFESAWDAFEFGYHILHSESNLAIVSMAWVTNKDRTRYSSMPYDPDLETLAYWATRLEPVIRAGDENGDDDEEVIVVFCNRCGAEGDVTYAGTSVVLGIRAGEVSVYGLLGRGEKELLVVDTDQPAFAKMVLYASSQGHEAGAVPATAGDPVADASMAEMLSLSIPSPKEIPEETAEEVIKASTPTAVSPLSPSPGGGETAAAAAHKKARPTPPPKLQIPQHGNGRGWRKEGKSSAGGRQEEDATRRAANNVPVAAAATTVATATPTPTAGPEAHIAEWLDSQAKAAAATTLPPPPPPPRSKPTDSGVEVSPGSYLGMGRPPTPARNARQRSRSPTGQPNAPASTRHRRHRSRGSDRGRVAPTATTATKMTTAASPMSERKIGPIGPEELRRQARRLRNFKDSPRCCEPDRAILGQFLSALAHSGEQAAAPGGAEEEEEEEEGDQIRTVTLDMPESIMIGASPSVLETSFPPIPPIPPIPSPFRTSVPGLSPAQAPTTPAGSGFPLNEMYEWRSLHSALGSRFRVPSDGWATGEGKAAGASAGASWEDGNIPFKLDIGRRHVDASL